LGYSVTRHAYGIETSFEVEYGSNGRVVVFNAEYDALPGIGHACGHNLIATSSIASFIATAEAIRDNGVSGRVRLLGTPAEESGGGKIKLLKAGAYQGVDACIMSHPGPSSSTHEGGKKISDGIAATRSLARKKVNVTFKGKTAHAGLNPWDGTNALDAVVAAYVNVSLLRQQIPQTARIHGIIRNGGMEPNLIPDEGSLEYFVRDASAASVNNIAKKVDACFSAGAQATGCSLECIWDE
jgi:amidohydrolase